MFIFCVGYYTYLMKPVTFGTLVTSRSPLGSNCFGRPSLLQLCIVPSGIHFVRLLDMVEKWQPTILKLMHIRHRILHNLKKQNNDASKVLYKAFRHCFVVLLNESKANYFQRFFHINGSNMKLPSLYTKMPRCK